MLEEISYPDLKLKVDKLVTVLSDKFGVEKGDTVATILPSCPAFIVADYTIMKLGAIHVPLSILCKAPEIQYELNESKAKILICSYRRLNRVKSIIEVVLIVS